MIRVKKGVKKGEVRLEVIVLKWESGPGDFMKNIGNILLIPLK